MVRLRHLQVSRQQGHRAQGPACSREEAIDGSHHGVRNSFVRARPGTLVAGSQMQAGRLTRSRSQQPRRGRGMISSPSGEPRTPMDGGMSSGQMVTDAEKIATVRGDFLRCYDSEYDQLIRFVMRLGASLQDAEDAVQQAFAEVWQGLVSRPESWQEVSNPRAWLRLIARRKYRRRDENHRQPLPVPVAEPDELRRSTPHTDTRHDELTLEKVYVLHAMRELDPLPQAVLAFTLDGFSAPEIAIHLGLKDDQEARDLLKKARRTLAREIARSRDQERRDQ